MAAASRHRLLASGRLVLPLALVAMIALVVVGHGAARVGAAIAAGLLAAGWLWSRVSARTLVLDDDGYAIEAWGRERLRVHWREVARVRHEPREPALYVDCGDKTRNLLVPPARGFGFRFAAAEAAVARVLASVPPERVETVERLEGTRADANAKAAKPGADEP